MHPEQKQALGISGHLITAGVLPHKQLGHVKLKVLVLICTSGAAVVFLGM